MNLLAFGTYDENCSAFTLDNEENIENLNVSEYFHQNFNSIFTTRAHTGSIKSIASNHTYIFSGSTDETIKVYDVIKKRECGTLYQHSGPVNGLHFFNTHVLSHSGDGTICIWDIAKGLSQWECLKVLKAHQGGVESISIHPSGRLCLSIGRTDRKLRLWNLIKGRAVHTLPLDASNLPMKIAWSPNGKNIILSSGKELFLYNLNFECENTCTHSEEIQDFIFFTETLLCIGCADGSIHGYEFPSLTKTFQFLASSKRIKSLGALESSTLGIRFLVAVTSEGHILFFQILSSSKQDEPFFTTLPKGKGEKIFRYPSSFDFHANSRITCLTIYNNQNPLKRKYPDQDPDQKEEDL